MTIASLDLHWTGLDWLWSSTRRGWETKRNDDLVQQTTTMIVWSLLHPMPVLILHLLNNAFISPLCLSIIYRANINYEIMRNIYAVCSTLVLCSCPRSLFLCLPSFCCPIWELRTKTDARLSSNGDGRHRSISVAPQWNSWMTATMIKQHAVRARGSYSFLRPPIQQIEDSQVKINDELNICRWWLLHDHRKVINMGWNIGEDKGRQDEEQWCGDNAVHLVPRNGRWSSRWYFDLIRGIQRKSIDKWRFYVAWFVTVAAAADASLGSLKSVSSSYADHS